MLLQVDRNGCHRCNFLSFLVKLGKRQKGHLSKVSDAGGEGMLLIPRKSEKHTPVVISECHASADNWLRFKVMCDVALIHNSATGRH